MTAAGNLGDIMIMPFLCRHRWQDGR